MSTLKLLYETSYPINDFIHVKIPTVGEVLDHEDDYYSLVYLLTAMPIDLMVMLDDAGVDWTTVNEYDVFLMMFTAMQAQDTSLVFDNLDLSKFAMAVNQQNGNVVLRDEANNITIDRAIHGQVARVLRRIHNLKQDRRKPANKEARDYMLERARIKAKRNRNRKQESELETLIVAMVNTPEFKYDFDGVRNMTIFQFNESVQQVIKKVEYNNRMIGVYAGTVSTKNLSQDDLNWLTHKQRR
ncbi:MAG: hypothetical protein LUD69_07925 [Oscillospiraceae bacterium]|nr:hypothetical protein [Oscillospiraceae bacterium]